MPKKGHIKDRFSGSFFKPTKKESCRKHAIQICKSFCPLLLGCYICYVGITSKEKYNKSSCTILNRNIYLEKDLLYLYLY